MSGASAWLTALGLVALLGLRGQASASGSAAPPAAAPPAAGSSADPPLSKKARIAQGKSPRHGPPPVPVTRPGTRPAKLINLHNYWTKEWLAVDPAAPPAQATVDHFLRDHFTNKPTAMQPRLLGFMLAAAARFHADTVEIVSGFRHPKYNLLLRKKGHQVARDSQHTHGDAIDFFLPGVPIAALHAWAKAQRLGGVGFYPESGFVHMDTGPIRAWSGE